MKKIKFFVYYGNKTKIIRAVNLGRAYKLAYKRAPRHYWCIIVSKY